MAEAEAEPEVNGTEEEEPPTADAEQPPPPQEEEEADAPPPPAEEEDGSSSPPPPPQENEAASPSQEGGKEPAADGEEAGSPKPERKRSSRRSTKGTDKEMMDFRHLMVKGLELKRFKDGTSEKCVIYMDVTCRTFFVAKQKNAANAKAYRVEDIAEAAANEGNEKIISIMHKDGVVDLEVSSPKVRDYLVRMLNKLFNLEKQKAEEAKSSGGKTSESASGSDRRSSKSSSGRKSRHRDDEGRSRKNQSQIQVLADHCYSLSDDKIDELVSAKIPTHSRWESYQEFKDKINRRDELIRSLQDGLGTMNSERVRFQRACEDIELHHQDELSELKGHLTMALQSFQELQQASEQRETEMREALKGAMEKSEKFEAEKSQLLDTMSNQRTNAASSLKEVEMLREQLTKLLTDTERKSAEVEDSRKRFTQVKEALTVERNLRARAEIKEEQMRQETIALTGQMHAMRLNLTEEIEDNSAEVAERTAELNEKIAEQEAAKEAVDKEVADLMARLEDVESKIEKLVSDQTTTADKREGLADLASKAGALAGLERSTTNLKQQKAEMVEQFENQKKEITEDRTVAEEKLVAHDDERRKLHNIIQELRGNIRVYVRVRPFLGPETGLENEMLVATQRELDGLNAQLADAVGVEKKDLEGRIKAAEAKIKEYQTTHVSTINVKNDGSTAEILRYEDGEIAESHKWQFDKSFDTTTSQNTIFAEVSEFVQSALDGFNVCLFSYGQTGSGKTHTMQGYGKGDMAGIIPRAIAQIGKYRDQTAEKGWVYTMEVTFIEIYNEVVYDLLREEGSQKDSLDIKQDTKGKTYVAGATKMSIDPTDHDAIDALMDLAAKHRQTASTNMNAQSSRSHSIFTLYLAGVNEGLGATVKGTLHLCDLAGSERINRSGAEGERLKEALNINKSLSCLTDVFSALGNRQSFIPFRNSKLTYFLQPALSGDGKTMMFVNLSPTEASYFESLCSLRFAANVNKVELGKAQRNILVDAPPSDRSTSPAPKSGSSPKPTSPAPSKSPARGGAAAKGAKGRATDKSPARAKRGGKR